VQQQEQHLEHHLPPPPPFETALQQAQVAEEEEEQQQRRQKLPVPITLLFGGVAGLVAQTVTYPLVRRAGGRGCKCEGATGGMYWGSCLLHGMCTMYYIMVRTTLVVQADTTVSTSGS
jgi:hypothetical protein